MEFRQALPTPPSEALQHSEQLHELIVHTIKQEGGSIPFRQFMQMALYQPELGYYVAGQEKFGANGDFITAPEISPLFSYCLADHCASVFTKWHANNPNSGKKSPAQKTILELGAGSGTMAADVLKHLSKLNTLPDQYLILEPSTELRQRQQSTLQQRCPELLKRVQWLQDLPNPQTVQGIIVANEVMDAMPVELFDIKISKTRETYPQTCKPADYVISSMHVTQHQKKLYLKPERSSTEQAEEVKRICLHNWEQHGENHDSPETYQSEYNPALKGWVKSLGNTLKKGEILLIDYGYERYDYYRPERNQGTLLCHYRHHVHAQPLLWPGLQDITCSVDFTAVAEAAEAAGLHVDSYQAQTDFLFNNGLESLFNAALSDHPEKQYQLAQQVRTLTLPTEMGERFKVMTLSKGIDTDTQQIASIELCNERRHRL